MLNLTSNTQKLINLGMTLALGATLFLSSSASAGSYTQTPTPDYTYCTEFKQVYAYSEWSKDAHLHLDVVCDEGYRAISCEAAIAGKNDYDYSKYYIDINEAHPEAFKKDRYGDYDHTSKHADYYGCHFRANNSLLYFQPSQHPKYAKDFYWRLRGFATCVPKDCVDFYETHEYYDAYDHPIDY